MSLPIPPTLEEAIGDLYWQGNDQKRRDRNKFYLGKVTDVDAEKGLVRAEITLGGQYPPVKTPWGPWLESAMGANKTHTPPSIGQQIGVTSRNGDMSDAEYSTSLPSDENQRPSTSGSEYYAAQVGDTTIRYTASEIILQVGGSKIVIDGGSVTITSPRIDLNP